MVRITAEPLGASPSSFVLIKQPPPARPRSADPRHGLEEQRRGLCPPQPLSEHRRPVHRARARPVAARAVAAISARTRAWRTASSYAPGAAGNDATSRRIPPAVQTMLERGLLEVQATRMIPMGLLVSAGLGSNPDENTSGGCVGSRSPRYPRFCLFPSPIPARAECGKRRPRQSARAAVRCPGALARCVSAPKGPQPRRWDQIIELAAKSIIAGVPIGADRDPTPNEFSP